LEQKACALSREELRYVCKLPEKFIKRQEHYKLAAIYRQDATGYAAAVSWLCPN
jgi:hypothetical protein